MRYPVPSLQCSGLSVDRKETNPATTLGPWVRQVHPFETKNLNRLRAPEGESGEHLYLQSSQENRARGDVLPSP